jgi:hypothetical protein
MEKKYITEILAITQDQPLRLETNAFTLYNNGTTNATINNFTLVPGASYSDNGWPGETNVSQYNIVFVGGTGELILFRKKYIN